MRQGIRDFLLVMSVLLGGLAISSLSLAADDEPVAADDEPVAAAAPAAQPEPEAAPPDQGSDAAEAETAEPAQEAPAEEDAGTDHPVPAEKHAEPTGDEADHGHGGEGGDGEHHDPYDLSHVNATPMIEDPSEFKSDLALWTLVVFLCLLALLGKFAWGPIIEGLERREVRIAAAIDEAEQAAAKGAEQLKLYEAKLAAAADETREIMAQARKDAEAARDRIVAEAQEAAARERDRAIADISAAKTSALQDITERSVDLAVAMAGQMIQRQLSPGDRATLIREALDQLPNQN